MLPFEDKQENMKPKTKINMILHLKIHILQSFKNISLSEVNYTYELKFSDDRG